MKRQCFTILDHFDLTLVLAVTIHLPSFLSVLALVGAASLFLAPRSRTAESFFAGQTNDGQPPGVLTLTFSQVTTWIFARSLLNAGILGYAFGIAGAVAYTAYYGSFLTGSLIVEHLRTQHGADNVQGFLRQKFGGIGTTCYNILVSLRLLSEVFANLLVVGIVFGTAGDLVADIAIVGVAGVALVYSMTGGLQASLRTDVLQTSLLLLIIAIPTGLMIGHDAFSVGEMVASSPKLGNPGWALLGVAFLQVLSYPMHDPVMMDRGFLADRDTTRRSFLHAFWISALLILCFGLLGVFAGLHAGGGEFLSGLEQLFGTTTTFFVGLALVLSAVSTMDSVFSSASKLAVRDIDFFAPTPRNGRIAMAGFALGGLLMVYLGTEDLFAAVAVSGTASLFLAPVIVFSIFLNWAVARWSYVAAFGAAVAGSVVYFLEDSGYVSVLQHWTGLEHSYPQLGVVTAVILATGFLFFAIGIEATDEETPAASAQRRAADEMP